MRRVVLALVVGVVVAALPAGAALAESQPYEMYFPLVGGGVPTDDFGDPRGDHTHEGNDILAPKMTEVVAVAAGTVGWVSDECCAFQLLHDDGWSSWYIHLNNDTPGTDDGLGWGMVDGIVPGADGRGRPVGGVGGGQRQRRGRRPPSPLRAAPSQRQGDRPPEAPPGGHGARRADRWEP